MPGERGPQPLAGAAGVAPKSVVDGLRREAFATVDAFQNDLDPLQEHEYRTWSLQTLQGHFRDLLGWSCL